MSVWRVIDGDGREHVATTRISKSRVSDSGCVNPQWVVKIGEGMTESIDRFHASIGERCCVARAASLRDISVAEVIAPGEQSRAEIARERDALRAEDRAALLAMERTRDALVAEQPDYAVRVAVFDAAVREFFEADDAYDAAASGYGDCEDRVVAWSACVAAGKRWTAARASLRALVTP